MKKKILTLSAIALLALAITSCKEEEPQQIIPGIDVELIDGVELDYENAFFDEKYQKNISRCCGIE